MDDCVTGAAPVVVVVDPPLPPEQADTAKSNKPAAMPAHTLATPETQWNMEASEEGTV